jgi:CheY-like chemotaxis protein
MSKILAVLDDLFFTVKIHDAAKRAAMPIAFLKSEVDVLAQAQEQPAVIVLDLNFAGIDPLQLVQKLKADPATKGIPVIGYLSHVQGELKQQAHQAGCDMVMPRSKFSQTLPQLFKRYAPSH